MARFEPNGSAAEVFVATTVTLTVTAGATEVLVIACETAPFPDSAAFRSGDVRELADFAVLELTLDVSAELDRTAWASACIGRATGDCFSAEPPLPCIETCKDPSPDEEAVSSAPCATAAEGLLFGTGSAEELAPVETLAPPPFEPAVELDCDRSVDLREATATSKLDRAGRLGGNCGA